VIFPDDDTKPAMNARVPVFRRLDLFEPVKLTNAF
jgi:hypothetical protein